MKSLTTLLITLPFSLSAQSKKELRAELLDQQTKNDSLTTVISTKNKSVDSLKVVAADYQKQLSAQAKVMEGLEKNLTYLRTSLNECIGEKEKLQSNIDSIKSAKTGEVGQPIKKNKGPEIPEKGWGSGDRHLITSPNIDAIKSDKDCTIRFYLKIDENGDIVWIKVIKSRTTTTDQKLIDKVTELVKTQAKYNKIPGENDVKELNIRIKAN